MVISSNLNNIITREKKGNIFWVYSTQVKVTDYAKPTDFKVSKTIKILIISHQHFVQIHKLIGTLVQLKAFIKKLI